MDNNPFNSSNSGLQHRRRGEEEEKPQKYAQLRQWLNIIFMIGAIAGVLLFYYQSQTVGIIVILSAMVFKIVECVLRILK